MARRGIDRSAGRERGLPALAERRLRRAAAGVEAGVDGASVTSQSSPGPRPRRRSRRSRRRRARPRAPGSRRCSGSAVRRLLPERGHAGAERAERRPVDRGRDVRRAAVERLAQREPPAGRSTRASSVTAVVSATCTSTERSTAASIDASGNGSTSASPTRYMIPFASASCASREQLLERADRRVDRDHPAVADPVVRGERQQPEPGADVEHGVARHERRRFEHALGLRDHRLVGPAVRDEPVRPAAHRWPK